jgi:NAD(P)-dependent dehydrogenase (short-subunit alcohol dehydrogenase family)
MLLKDKVVIISGIGPGLGVKLAVEAARYGASALALGARTQEKLEDAVRRIKEVNPDCAVVQQTTDIRDVAQCASLAEATRSRFGRIDGLVNSAFFWGNPGTADSGDLKSWREVVETNFFGTMQMTQAVTPIMKAQKSGAITIVSTMATLKPHEGEAGYAASKGALNVVTKYLATELGPFNIRVNIARMGWMWGAPVQGYIAFASKEKGMTEKQMYDAVAANIPLRRIVTDEECARAALFLISDHASAITGAVLDANGGEGLP